ncbi:hypothetical protein MMC19_000119 [Ptychographa xylographoides]|nr:hypothetical protein [Ptychographa xylographoides]
MSDKRPTPQHVVQAAEYGIRGNAKSLSQLSSSGEATQKRRGKTPAQIQAAEASSGKFSSSHVKENTSQGGSDPKG